MQEAGKMFPMVALSPISPPLPGLVRFTAGLFSVTPKGAYLTGRSLVILTHCLLLFGVAEIVAGTRLNRLKWVKFTFQEDAPN